MHSLISSMPVVFCLLLQANPDPSEVDRLIATLREGDWLAQLAAAEKLEEMGPRAEKAIPVFIEMIKSKDDKHRLMAKSGLVAIGKPSIGPLEAVIRDHKLSAKTRSAAVEALACAGAEKLDVLIDALTDIHPRVRASAAGGLGVTGHKEAVFILARAAGDGCAEVRVAVALALGNLKTHPALAMETLGQLLRDHRDEWVRIRAAEAMRSYPSHANMAVPHLVRATRDRCGIVRTEAIRGLCSVAKENATARMAIIDRLKDPFWEVRSQAAMAVAEIGPKCVEAVPELIFIISSQGPSVLDRSSAIRALEAIGPPASAALPALREIAAKNVSDDLRENFRQAAQDAISRITKKP